LRTFLDWLYRRKFQAYLLAFALMVLPPVPLYLAARQGADAWIWLLIGLVVFGNILAIVVP
jgi:hypothetical protein